ncbi:MAG TPA: hypothetical protein VGF40_13985 [Thermoanaerobaculia bacterium]
MEDRYTDPHERAAGGLDFDDDFRARASSFGSQLAEGPEAMLEKVEELLPESWREQIRHFPLTAIAIGVGVGVFLGMKKGDEVIAAGSSLIAAAATANLNAALGKMRGGEEEE